MSYTFKLFPELLWAGGIALLVFALTALLDLEDVTDWRAWAISLGTGAARAFAGAALDVLRRAKMAGSAGA